MNEADNLQEPQGNGVLPCVSGLLFLHDIEELDSIILELNRREITLEEFVSKVWNTGYTLGRKDGYHCNSR